MRDVCSIVKFIVNACFIFKIFFQNNDTSIKIKGLFIMRIKMMQEFCLALQRKNTNNCSTVWSIFFGAKIIWTNRYKIFSELRVSKVFFFFFQILNVSNIYFNTSYFFALIMFCF